MAEQTSARTSRYTPCHFDRREKTGTSCRAAWDLVRNDFPNSPPQHCRSGLSLTPVDHAFRCRAEARHTEFGTPPSVAGEPRGDERTARFGGCRGAPLRRGRGFGTRDSEVVVPLLNPSSRSLRLPAASPGGRENRDGRPARQPPKGASARSGTSVVIRSLGPGD